MSSQLSTLSRNAYQLEKELAKKKAEFAKRDDELRAAQPTEQPAQVQEPVEVVVQQEPEKAEPVSEVKEAQPTEQLEQV